MLLNHYIVIILLIMIIIVPVNVSIMNKNNINSISLLYWYNYIILNMDIRLFLDPITMEKIRDAVKSGKYDDEYEFIFEAIHEKLNQSDSKQSETLLEIVDEGKKEMNFVTGYLYIHCQTNLWKLWKGSYSKTKRIQKNFLRAKFMVQDQLG
jgi:hypothetical protein